MTQPDYPLFSDEPATSDLLSFGAVAATVSDAILNPNLNPVALGVSGPWGSGKTTVLELIRIDVEARRKGKDAGILVISTEPWRYDPSVGPKESIIAEVLAAVDAEIKDGEGVGKKAKGIVRGLAKKVNWAKAFKMAATTGLTMQLPSLDDLTQLVKEGGGDSLSDERGLAEFRKDFKDLLKSDGLKHIAGVVVLVDDLDRCLPDTVVDTLEAIRLFLSVEGMSFVIAADEDRVADAIGQKLKMPQAERGDERESPAKLYLHKIVQTTVPLPGLSRFDTQAYLFLLMVRGAVSDQQFSDLVSSTFELRRAARSLDDLDLPDGLDVLGHLATAARLTPILYEKFRGNPRRVKRFLNDLSVRESIARRRGITLSADAVAKLMVLEKILPDDFETMIGWLSKNELRDQLESLEKLATSPVVADAAGVKPTAQTGKPGAKKQEVKSDEEFSDTLIRWAKLSPSLDVADIGAYLYLAASFAGIELTDDGLPERLRDIASALASSIRSDRAVVDENTIRAISTSDARTLILHLGKRTRDEPSIQQYSVFGMLRIAKIHKSASDAVVASLKLLPPSAVRVPSVMLLKPEDSKLYEPVLSLWDVEAATSRTRQAILNVRTEWGRADGDK